jgi:hypothetical protein
LVSFASAAAKDATGSGTKEFTPSMACTRADPMSASTLSGSAVSARSKKLRARHSVGGRHTLVEPSQSLKIEVHRVGARDLLCASRLGGHKLGVERGRQARDDFVLHVEEIGRGFVEPLSPEMIAALGVK